MRCTFTLQSEWTCGDRVTLQLGLTAFIASASASHARITRRAAVRTAPSATVAAFSGRKTARAARWAPGRRGRKKAGSTCHSLTLSLLPGEKGGGTKRVAKKIDRLLFRKNWNAFLIYMQ